MANQQQVFLDVMRSKYTEKTESLVKEASEMKKRIEVMENLINGTSDGEFCKCKGDQGSLKGSSRTSADRYGPNAPPRPSSDGTNIGDVPFKAPTAVSADAEKKGGFFSSLFKCKSPELGPQGDVMPAKQPVRDVPEQDNPKRLGNSPENAQTCCDEEEEVCGCVECPYFDGAGALGGGVAQMGSNLTTHTLDGDDFENLKALYEMANQERELKTQIESLKDREAYVSKILTQFKEMNSRECLCDLVEIMNPTTTDIGKENNELKTENLMLKTELKDMRLELRHYLERAENPLQLQLHNERQKNLMLEEKLQGLSKEIVSVEKFYSKELNTVKMQLCCARTNIDDLNDINAGLRKEIETLNEKYMKLEEDSFRQKLSDSETIHRLMQQLELMSMPTKDECDENLNQIARQLSKVLRDIEPCEECANLPPEAKMTAHYIKQLIDMVDLKVNAVTKRDSIHALDVIVEEIEEEIPDASVVRPSKTPPNSPVEVEPTYDEIENTVTLDWGEDESTNVASGAIATVVNDLVGSSITEAEARAQTPKTGVCVCVECPGKQPVRCEAIEEPDIVQKLRETFCECIQTLNLMQQATAPPEPEPEPEPMQSPCTCGLKNAVPLEPEPEPEPEPKQSPCACGVKKASQGDKSEFTDVTTGESGMKPDTGVEPTSPESGVEQFDESAIESSAVEPVDGANQELTQTTFGQVTGVNIAHRVEAANTFSEVKSLTEIRAPANFPFKVDTDVEIIDKPPKGVHITTTVTKSGTIEVITEGPEGIVETILTYTDDGAIEIVTDIHEPNNAIEGSGGPKIEEITEGCICDESADADKKEGEGNVQESASTEIKNEELENKESDFKPVTASSSKSLERIVIGEN